MKRNLLLLISLLFLGINFTANAQGGKLEVQIIQTDAAISDSVWVEDPVTGEDTLFAVIMVPLSSDDAEEIWATMEDPEPEIDDLNDDDLDMGWEGDPEDLNIVSVGLRFQDITIPQGETIDSAFLLLCSHEEKAADDIANITIWGDASDDAGTFTEDSLITGRPSTTATVDWVIDYEWGLWTWERTPDIAEIIQEIVDRPGWVSGNSIALIMEGENQGVSEVENAREFESFENIADPEEGGDGQNHSERVPWLVVYWGGFVTEIDAVTTDNAFILSPNPCTNGLLNVRIESSGAVLTIYNISGKPVKSFDLNTESNSLDVSELNSGIYIVKAIQNNSTSIQKLIIE